MRLWLAAGVLLGGGLATLVFAPASWVAHALAHATEHRVLLRSPLGTVWTGSAQLVLSAGPGTQSNTALPSRLSWRMRPSWSGLELELQAVCCMQQSWRWLAQPSTSGVTLAFSDVPPSQSIKIPSALLSGLGTPWNTLQFQGALAFSSQALSLQWQSAGWGLTGQAQLDALRMSSTLSPLKPVGSYRMVLRGGSEPRLELSTLEGALTLRGSGNWPQGRFRFEGQGTADPQSAEALDNLLNIIGRRDGLRSVIKVGLAQHFASQTAS